MSRPLVHALKGQAVLCGDLRWGTAYKMAAAPSKLKLRVTCPDCRKHDDFVARISKVKS